MGLQEQSKHKINHEVKESVALDHRTHRNNDSSKFKQGDPLGGGRGRADRGLICDVEILLFSKDFFKLKQHELYKWQEMLFIHQYLFLNKMLCTVILLSKF